jgi:hypothetical protein
MKNNESPQSESTVKPIIVAVVIALLAGSTGPWWWESLFPSTKDPAEASSPTSTTPTTSPISLSPDPFYLADYPVAVLKKFNIHGDLQLGRVYWQPDVWIDGLQYKHAIGMAAPDNGIGYADFKVPPGAASFQTVFGIARDDKASTSFGSAIGRIYLDDNLVWESGASGPTAIHSPIIQLPSGTKKLRLEVDSDGSNWSDQTTWGDPYFSGPK